MFPIGLGLTFPSVPQILLDSKAAGPPFEEFVLDLDASDDFDIPTSGRRNPIGRTLEIYGFLGESELDSPMFPIVPNGSYETPSPSASPSLFEVPGHVRKKMSTLKDIIDFFCDKTPCPKRVRRISMFIEDRVTLVRRNAMRRTRIASRVRVIGQHCVHKGY
jgi:hypothetical protein